MHELPYDCIASYNVFISLIVLAISSPSILALSNQPILPKVNVLDFGAHGDNSTDNTNAFAAAMHAVLGGGTVIVPGPGIYQTGPFNLTSHITLEIQSHAVIRSVANQSIFPLVAPLPSYGGSRDVGRLRHHAQVWSVGQKNVRIIGKGTIDGAGSYWWNLFHTKQLKAGRPHLVEFNNCSDVEISGVTLVDSGFWTLHPVYSNNVWIHDITINAPWGSPNTDGIDPDSSVNVTIERCHISCGDDHIAIKSGIDAYGLAVGLPSRNITVRDCVLGHGMGISIGSEVSGGVEDVLVIGNTINESRTEWGNGFLIKTGPSRGGFIRRITYDSNTLYNVTDIALQIRTNYNGGKPPVTGVTEIRDILYRNLTVDFARSPGAFRCFSPKERPCINITVQDVHIETTGHWNCDNVTHSNVKDVSPQGLDSCFANSAQFTV